MLSHGACGEPHLSEDDLILHLRGKLEFNRVIRAESHLVQCAACEQALAETNRFLGTLTGAAPHAGEWWRPDTHLLQ